MLLSGLAHAKVRSTDMQVEKEDLGKRASARKGLSNVTVGLGSSFKMFIWGNSVRVGFKGLKEVLYNAKRDFHLFAHKKDFPTQFTLCNRIAQDFDASASPSVVSPLV